MDVLAYTLFFSRCKKEFGTDPNKCHIMILIVFSVEMEMKIDANMIMPTNNHIAIGQNNRNMICFFHIVHPSSISSAS